MPRLGSRVRIPSPAPDFIKELSGLERSFGAAFCFPGLWTGVGEALGKQQGADCGGRPNALGTGLHSNRLPRAGLRAPLASPIQSSPLTAQRRPRSTATPRHVLKRSPDVRISLIDRPFHPLRIKPLSFGVETSCSSTAEPRKYPFARCPHVLAPNWVTCPQNQHTSNSIRFIPSKSALLSPTRER